MTILSRVHGPSDVKALGADELPQLASEIRTFLVDAVCRTGGHLGSNLGAVELTIALHRVFDSPRDTILWDTGHQAYAHKLLTGRRAAFAQLRQRGGLSGYPSRSESDHDVIENSHASTALSYADGVAKARALTNDSDRCVVAVVGDGALTGGLAWEALNNIGAAQHRPVVIVVNDNGRSYAPTVGAVAAALRGSGAAELFGSLGFSYIGPVDGHDITTMETALRTARESRAPVVVHCRTVKGRGYQPAEDDVTDCLHGVGVIDPATGRPAQTGPTTWTRIFGDELVRIAADQPDVVAVTAAMCHPVGLAPFAAAYPDRTFDVGIAEQHAVASAAGLAYAGLKPVVCIYATFLNRAFDQVLLDVGLHQAPVTFVLDRAGVTGDDGPSHHGMWDLGLLGSVPGLAIAAPRDAATLRSELREAIDDRSRPTVVRFPKADVGADVPAVGRFGSADVLWRSGDLDVLIVAVGVLAANAVAAAELVAGDGVGVTVVDPRWVQPLDPSLVALAIQHRLVVTVEDGGVVGGVGSRLRARVDDTPNRPPVLSLGLPQEYLPHARRADMLTAAGLSADAIAARIRDSVTPIRLPEYASIVSAK